MPTAKKSGSATSARGKAESAAKSSAKTKLAAIKSASAKPPKHKPAAAATIEAADLVGRRAPDFSLPDQDGTLVSLKSLTEKGDVVLYFYPKDMTPGCTVEACCFRDAIGKITALGAQVVGVSADSASSHLRFIDKHGLNFPLLSDPDNRITAAYGVYRKKSLYGREYMGIERTTFIIGRDGIVKRVFSKVKVNGHADEVIAALENRS
jgi:peroxiredoxin Q/BCP